MVRALATHYFNSSPQPKSTEDYEMICKNLLKNYKFLHEYVKNIVDHINANKTESRYRLQYHVSIIFIF
jgi:uncharacterized protein YozE (UPF0346 family)